MNRLRWATGIVLAGVVCGAGAGSVAPVEVHGVAFAASSAVGEQALVLQGAGLLRYLRVVPVYVAGLYVDPGANMVDPLGDFTKSLEVEYLVSAPAKDFNDAGTRTLRAALTKAEYAAVEARVHEISGWYPDVNEGDRCMLTYVPGRGTELIYNGQSLGIIPGDDFQRAYFAIWLGDKPASEPLRDALLKTRKKG